MPAPRKMTRRLKKVASLLAQTHVVFAELITALGAGGVGVTGQIVITARAFQVR